MNKSKKSQMDITTPIIVKKGKEYQRWLEQAVVDQSYLEMNERLHSEGNVIRKLVLEWLTLNVPMSEDKKWFRAGSVDPQIPDIDRLRSLIDPSFDIRVPKLKKQLKDLGYNSQRSNELVVEYIKEGHEPQDGYFLGKDVVERVETVLDETTYSGPVPNTIPSHWREHRPGDLVTVRATSETTARVIWHGPRKTRFYCVITDEGQGYHRASKRTFDFLNPERFPLKINSTVEVELEPGSDGIWDPAQPIWGARILREVSRGETLSDELKIAQEEYGIPVEFDEAALAEAERLGDKVDRRSLKGRVDLRDIPFVTIDGEDARDFDDAVWAQEQPDGGWRLLVAIADVSHYVKPESALDQEAQSRGTSVYFPKSVVPMLPEALSNGLCSLNPNVDRLTMVCDAVLDALGVVRAYQFYPAVIHSHARLTYTQVWSAIQEEDEGKAALGERLEDVMVLYRLSQTLLERRHERHCLDFETSELKAVLDEKDRIVGFEKRSINDANRLIEECMLVANVCAAQFVEKFKRLTLFRVHDKPAPDRLAKLNVVLKTFKLPKVTDTPESIQAVIEQAKDNEFVQVQILRTMSRACYSPDNVGHYGLQYGSYAHFTSPIRRYPDLLLHRTIKGILSHHRYSPKVIVDVASEDTHAELELRERRKLTPEQQANGQDPDYPVWDKLGMMCSLTERRADMATREVMDYLRCQYVLSLLESRDKKKTRSLPAMISGVIPAGIFCTIPSLGIDGFVHVSQLGWGWYEFSEKDLRHYSEDEGTSFAVGDSVTVDIASVDMAKYHVDLRIVASKAPRPKRKPRRRNGRYLDDFALFDDFDEEGPF